MHVRRCVLGFHRGVREERSAVDRLERLRAVNIVDAVTALKRNLPLSRIARHALRNREHRSAVELRVRTFVPLDDQRVPALECSPCIAGDDGDAGRHFDRVQHAVNRLGLAGVEAADFAAKNRRTRDRGIMHSRNFDVHSEPRGSVDFRGNVEPASRCSADELEL